MRIYGAISSLAVACAATCIAGHARADCFEEAAGYQHVNPTILRAIAWQESHGHAEAKHLNANGSVDYGMMQINSIHLGDLSRYGVSRTMLMDACVSVYVAAWHLKRMMIKYGNTWAAVGAYHSESPRERDLYQQQVRAIVRRLLVVDTRAPVAPGETVVKSAPSDRPT
jgi:lysozyme-related protein Hpa2